MEDRYLFRGKDIKSNEFKIGFYSACPEGIPEDGITLLHYITDINNNVFVVYPKTVGRCTALKDKNGVLIFEGDKVLCNRNQNHITDKYVFTVAFQHDKWILDHSFCEETSMIPWEMTEIIGNAHDPQGAERGTE